MEILRDKFDFIDRYRGFYEAVDSTILFSDAKTLEQIQDELHQKGYFFSDKEVYMVLYKLICNWERVVRDDYWSGPSQYKYLDRYYWEHNVQRKYYSLEDDSVGTPKVMAFLSDTHIGNDKVYNAKIINGFYEFAVKNNATRCFHLGDLFEGIRNVSDLEKEKEMFRQFEIFEKEYPFAPEILTFCLLGNHDKTIDDFLSARSWLTKEDLRCITQLKPNVYMIPNNENWINGWRSQANGRDIHFNHQLFLSIMIENCKINSIDDIEEALKFLDYHYDLLVSGHLHQGFVYTVPNKYKKEDNIYLSIPSTSNLCLGKAIGMVVNLAGDGNSMEIIVAGADEFGNVKEIDRMDLDFKKKEKIYKKML